jgi:acyl-coenzyme A synthetase/AMP-(fatty) acid ligase
MEIVDMGAGRSRRDRSDAAPEERVMVPGMPKARSGKIMLRVIVGISRFADGDTGARGTPQRSSA